MNVLAVPLIGDLLLIHAPPLGFVPPAPDEWGDYRNLHAWCGQPCVAQKAGYGDVEIVLQAQAEGHLHLIWCPACFPDVR